MIKVIYFSKADKIVDSLNDITLSLLNNLCHSGEAESLDRI